MVDSGKKIYMKSTPGTMGCYCLLTLLLPCCIGFFFSVIIRTFNYSYGSLSNFPKIHGRQCLCNVSVCAVPYFSALRFSCDFSYFPQGLLSIATAVAIYFHHCFDRGGVSTTLAITSLRS